MLKEAELLSLVVGRYGIRAHPHKVEVTQIWPLPINLTELRSLLGLIQFFRRFFREFSACAAPFYVVLQKRTGLRQWNKFAQGAFMGMKSALMTAPALVSPD